MDTQGSIACFRAQPTLRGFAARLDDLKKLTGLSWKEITAYLGVKGGRVMRYRKGMRPRAGAPEAMVRSARVVPGGRETTLLNTAGCTCRAS